jgi:hypothetical protein
MTLHLRRLFGCELRYIEYVSAAFAVVWGGWLSLPVIDFGRPAYLVMAAIAPQWVWGSLFVITGGLLWWALATDRRWWRKLALTMLFVLWLAVGVCLGLSNLSSTAFTTYFYIAAIHGFAQMRLGRVDR